MVYKKPPVQEILKKEEWSPTQFESLGNDWYKFSDGNYAGQVKLYSMPSEYGINGGRASKLWLNKDNKNIANYDRGWDTPSGKFELAPEHLDFYNKLIKFFENYRG